MKQVFNSALADRDITEIILYYEEETGVIVAGDFVDALQEIIGRIAAWPSSGSPVFAELLSLPGLRLWRLSRFPYIVFTMELADRITVVRVLHERRDIPSTLQASLDEDPDW